MREFDDSFKLRVFDKISAEFYDRNFGSFSKADLETLLFSEYIEYLIEKKESFDDYTISQQLGITQSRVRALKERKELKYPIGEDYWENSFAKSIEKAQYDEDKKRIIIPISDVNVMIEVRHCIEEKGLYDEYQLNRKLLTINMGCFLELCVKLSERDVFSDEAKKRIREIEKNRDLEDDISDFLNDFSVNGLKRFVTNASPKVVCEVIGKLKYGGIAEAFAKALIVAIQGKN